MASYSCLYLKCRVTVFQGVVWGIHGLCTCISVSFSLKQHTHTVFRHGGRETLCNLSALVAVPLDGANLWPLNSRQEEESLRHFRACLTMASSTTGDGVSEAQTGKKSKKSKNQGEWRTPRSLKTLSDTRRPARCNAQLKRVGWPACLHVSCTD